ncbi:MAG: hypothetical protein ACE5RF_07610 [Nitrosarchaeum sp.]
MKFNKKTKRGLSTIVTSAILLSSVAVMGVLIVNWANTNLTKHQNNLDSTISSTTNKINEKLIVEHIWFGAGQSMNITMSNVGTVGLNVTKIQITNTTSNQIYTFTHTNGGIKPGAALSFNEPFGWKPKISHEILIFTDRGSQFKTWVNSP